eukprot:76719-Prymnesium_polylepis.1
MSYASPGTSRNVKHPRPEAEPIAVSHSPLPQPPALRCPVACSPAAPYVTLHRHSCHRGPPSQPCPAARRVACQTLVPEHDPEQSPAQRR